MNFKPFATQFAAEMDSKQLIDCLADHLALYHSASSSPAPNAPQSKFRNNVLSWLSNLNVEQRQAALTIVDEQWVTILLQMEAKIRENGPGFFILLPDVPIETQEVQLPSLCYRKAKGLLSRAYLNNEEENKLVGSLRLFSSKEGQFEAQKPNFDALLVAEDLVKDVGSFVGVMDRVSDGGFLRGGNNCSNSVSAWEELNWLKGKGYYSVGAFVGNRVEIALRMSWMNSHGKKRGGNGNGLGMAGLAANVFWRKRVCVDWWRNVEEEVKARAFRVAVSKAAKFEVNLLVGDVKDVVGKKTRSFGESSVVQRVSSDLRVSYNDNDLKCHAIPGYLQPKHSHGCNFLSGLHMLQELSLSEVICKSAVPRDDNLFFSSLSSTNTVLDNIMRRVREVFAKVSKDYVELDLLNEEKAKNNAEVTKKVKRKKGRSKKKKVTPSEQTLQNTFAKQPLEDASPKKMACEEFVQNMNKEMDSRKGITNLQTDPGKTKVKIKKEKHQSFKFQEKDRSPSRLEKNLETEQLDMVEVHVKNNKQGRSRSKLKKKDTVNLDVALLTNGKGRMPGNCCEQTKQQAVDIQLCSSVQYDKYSGHSDGSVGKFCSPSINSSSSLVSSTNICTDDNRWVCSAKQTITCLDKVGTEAPLSMIDFQVNDDTDFKKVGAQNDSSPKSSIFERDKGDANFLSRDCKSTSASVVPLKGINLDGIIPSSGVELSSPMQHRKLNNKLEHENSQCSLKPNTFCSGMCNSNSVELLVTQDVPRDDLQQQQRSRNQDRLMQETATFMPHTSYEWPGSLHRRFPTYNGHPLPETTDRLHLDVDCKLQHHCQPSVLASRQSMVRNSSGQGGYLKRNTKCQAPRKGSEQIGCNLLLSIGHSFEPGFTPFMQPSFQTGYITSNLELNGHIRMKEDSKCEETDDSTCDDLKYVSGYIDDFEGYVMSEGEVEKLSYGNASNNADYNQVFGGGVMYWNTADYAGSGFSRPPSLSSEDSSWARHEDDMKFVIEDIVNITSLPGTCGNGGVTSPRTTFHSNFDQFTIAPSSVGLVPVSEEKDNRLTSKCTIGVVDGIKGEALPHPILRPINIPNFSKQRARSDFSKSPCLTGNQREPLRLKRPPSPVVLCVPPAPPPPPPSPIGGFRKQRRFPNVRSGSSSPRHWGLSGWPSESEMDLEDCRLSTGNPEVVNFAWRRKCITATLPMHSLPSALLRDRLVAISQVGLEQEHPDIALPLQSAVIKNNPAFQASVSKLHSLLHDEIESFCTQVAAENLMRTPFINAAVERVSRALQVLWPRSRTKIFGSIATGLAVPTSDVDLVVCLPPVRNLEPIKEAGILEGRNGIKETCLQHAARYLADQEWVKSDSLKTIENTAIPIIMIKVKTLPQNYSRNEDHHMISSKVRGEKEGGDMPCKVESESPSGSVRSDASACETRKTPWGSKDSRELVHLDISFESPSHTGLKTANLVRELIDHFPAIVPLALVLKQFLTDRSLDHPYSGGLGSYCLVLLITRFLQHEHHCSRAVNQNLGSLFMDFLYFFGCVFDPRQMRVSIYGSGMYLNRDRGQSIDPLHIDDPLHQANNVGRNCFRIHQCIKAFADAHSVLEKEVIHLSNIMDSNEGESVKVLPKVIPSIADMYE